MAVAVAAVPAIFESVAAVPAILVAAAAGVAAATATVAVASGQVDSNSFLPRVALWLGIFSFECGKLV